MACKYFKPIIISVKYLNSLLRPFVNFTGLAYFILQNISKNFWRELRKFVISWQKYQHSNKIIILYLRFKICFFLLTISGLAYKYFNFLMVAYNN